MVTNGTSHKQLSESEQRIRKILDPISSALAKVNGATKKKIPDDDERLKMIKAGLLTIGNHINAQVHNDGQTPMEDKMWDHVSEHYWPQSKSNDKRVSGRKLGVALASWRRWLRRIQGLSLYPTRHQVLRSRFASSNSDQERV